MALLFDAKSPGGGMSAFTLNANRCPDFRLFEEREKYKCDE
jgi:hypothetical protein